MDEKFKTLMSNTELYNPDLITFFLSGPHYTFETWQQRERSLAHDIVCLLLCNMELSPDAPIKMIDEFASLKRKRKREMEAIDILDPGPSTSKRAREELIRSQEIESEPELSDDSVSDLEEGEIPDVFSEQKYFRYKLLEGLPGAPTLQEYYTNGWEIPARTKTFDIIDTVERKFIEFKFSVSYVKKLLSFINDEENDSHNSLVVMDPDTAEYKSHNLVDKLPGVSKATVWINRRKIEMDLLGITNSPFDDEVDITNFCFVNPGLRQILKEFKDFYLQGSNEKVDMSTIPEMDDILHLMKPSILFDKLGKDHFNPEYPEIVWTGKLLPSVWKTHTITEGTDIDVLDQIVNLLDYSVREKVEGDQELVDALDIFMARWDSINSDYKNFNLYSTKSVKLRNEIPSGLRNVLGINMKRKVYNVIEGLKQPDYSGIKKRRYSNWFDQLYVEMGNKTPFVDESCISLGFEKEDRVEMHREMAKVVEMVNDNVGGTYAGISISEYTNTFSRLSGSYLAGATKSSNHARISVIPIISNYTKKLTGGKKELLKRFSGLILRGPCHAREMSDRTNIMTVEFIGRDIPLERFQNCAKITLFEGPIILLRRNAYKKLDGPYWTFIRNSLFNPVNLLGEMVLKEMDNTGKTPPELQLDQLTTKESISFITNRVVDNLFMSMIGNSRDEGYFAFARKILMIIICYRRGDIPGSFDVNEFCASCNECLIDNPLSMFLHNSFLYVLAKLSLS